MTSSGGLTSNLVLGSSVQPKSPTIALYSSTPTETLMPFGDITDVKIWEARSPRYLRCPRPTTMAITAKNLPTGPCTTAIPSSMCFKNSWNSSQIITGFNQHWCRQRPGPSCRHGPEGSSQSSAPNRPAIWLGWLVWRSSTPNVV